jgi:hypothetical protein
MRTARMELRLKLRAIQIMKNPFTHSGKKVKGLVDCPGWSGSGQSCNGSETVISTPARLGDDTEVMRYARSEAQGLCWTVLSDTRPPCDTL